MTSDARFFEPSQYASDDGAMVGKPPGAVSLDDLRWLGHQPRPLKAIRAKCLDCCAGQMTEVRKCVSAKCALWPFRMGSSPFRTASASDQPEGACT